MRPKAWVRRYSCGPTVGARSFVCSAWKVQQMNAVKPLLLSCCTRSRSKCSIRSSMVSTCPNIMVAEDFTEMNELAWTKAVDIDLREFAFDVRQQIEIPLFGEFRMVAALHQNLGAAQGEGLVDFPVDFVEGDDVRVVVFFGAI